MIGSMNVNVTLITLKIKIFKMNIFKFTKDVLFDHQTTINWCMDHRLIPREKRCPKNQCRKSIVKNQ